MYALGLSGGAHSARRRRALLRRLGLPELLPAGGFLSVINALFSRAEFAALCAQSQARSDGEQEA
jgi:ribonuclease M5